MMGRRFTCAALAAALLAMTAAFGAPPRKVVNIVNFVRALDPRKPKSEYIRALREEVALNLKYGFENTILLQYDALVDAEMMAEARKSNPTKTEFGLWFEMSRPHNEAAGLAWRPTEKHKGWEWDWFINPGFLMAYDHDGRRKLIDAAFARFKAEFGAWPKSVGSWLLDAWSMDYMVKTYGVDGFCICREQDSTDAYGLRGGYSNGAYYPSRKNMLSAAVDMKNAVRAPVFKMLTPDPIYNYGLPHKLYPGYPHSGGCPTMEPVWYGGHTPAIVDWYFRVYTEPKGLLNLSYMQTGQENAFGWPMISKGLPMQCAKIAAEVAAGRVVVEKMGDTARAFKAAHGANCPQTQIALEDWAGAGRKSVWYNSRFYRANLVMDGHRLFFRDIHKMSDDFEEPFLNKVCIGWQALYYTPPVVDQWLFRSDDASGAMALSGEFISLETAAEGDSVLTVTATRADGTSAKVRFEEGRIVVTGCGLSGEYAADFRKTLSVVADGVDFEFGGYSYRVPVRGKTQATAKGFRIDGDRIELDLTSDASPIFNGGLWRTFTYDKPSATPIFFSGESRCEGVTEGQYCIYLDIWYDDGKPVWGKKAEWEWGTHGWEKASGAFVPAKPVKKIEMHVFLRRGRGKAQFRNLRLERREGNGDVLNHFRRTERPYVNQDRILSNVFTGRKIVQQEEKVPVSPPYADNPLAPDEVVVWTADAMRKVTPLTFPGETERKGKVAASLSLARRESESFQVQVSTGANAEWREGGVTLPVLRNARGEAFKGTVDWRRVGYVAREPGYHTHPQGAPETELWLPDPLLPPAPFKVRRSSTQGLWFTVKAAPDARAGEYSGDIALTEGGERRATVRVKVRVEDFSLPKTFGMQTAFSVMDGFTRAQYPGRFKEKRRESWDIMLDHRLNPDDISRTEPPEIEELLYARSRGMNRFNILNIVPPPTDPKRKWVCAASREATEDPAFYPAFKARLEPYVAELRRHGLDRYAYIYGFDEREHEYYPGIDALWKKLKADFPDIPVMTTAMMYRDYAAGKTNLPCLVTTDWYCPLTKVYRKDISDEMRRLGKQVWWYVCCSPNYPFANFASQEYLPIEGRILGWMTHLYRADGLLYWHVNWWKDACLDESDTYFPNWRTGPIPRMPGDGVLMYPGKDHILPSIRLAQVRDCVEDYEWLQLAAAKGGTEAADTASRTLIRSMTDFTRDAAQLLEMRARLAAIITGPIAAE